MVTQLTCVWMVCLERVEMPSFGECVDYRKRTRHKLEKRWLRGVFVGVQVKTTQRIVMDETGTYVVQSVRRVPEEQRYDHRLLQIVSGSPWEPNPGDVSTFLPEPLLTVTQQPDVEPTPTETFHSSQNRHRKVWLHGGMSTLRSSPRRIASAWAGTHRRVQETTRRRDDGRHIHSDPSQSNTGQAERIIKDLDDSWAANSSSSSGSGQHKRVRFLDPEQALGLET